MLTRRQLRAAQITAALVFVALALPAAAFGQATRTWVSGVGDDANPCSRTAPCKTFAGAISKTATNGEINCLDPAGYGTLTITKSLTIKCHYTEGGVLSAGVPGFTINALSTSVVTLRGMDVNGVGTGTVGVQILAAKSVKILDSEIYNTTSNGIILRNVGTTKLGVYNTHIHDNVGNGILVAPASGATGKASIANSIIEENSCGVSATQNGAGTAGASNCGTNAGVPAATTTPLASVLHSVLDNTGVAIFSRGNGTTIRAGDNAITHNVVGFATADSGGIGTWGDNYFGGNTVNGPATGNATKG